MVKNKIKQYTLVRIKQEMCIPVILEGDECVN